MDLLGKYELVRVRLPDGLDIRKTVQALERLLDAVCVLQIGFTATLYRCVSACFTKKTFSIATPCRIARLYQWSLGEAL